MPLLAGWSGTHTYVYVHIYLGVYVCTHIFAPKSMLPVCTAQPKSNHEDSVRQYAGVCVHCSSAKENKTPYNVLHKCTNNKLALR